MVALRNVKLSLGLTKNKVVVVSSLSAGLFVRSQKSRAAWCSCTRGATVRHKDEPLKKLVVCGSPARARAGITQQHDGREQQAQQA